MTESAINLQQIADALAEDFEALRVPCAVPWMHRRNDAEDGTLIALHNANCPGYRPVTIPDDSAELARVPWLAALLAEMRGRGYKYCSNCGPDTWYIFWVNWENPYEGRGNTEAEALLRALWAAKG